MKLLIGLLIPFLLSLCSRVAPFSDNKMLKDDTAYILIDSSTINKTENIFDYMLIFESGHKKYKIDIEENQDYSIEFEYNFSYSDDKNNYTCFTYYSLPDGSRWDILFDKENNSFYHTDTYDTKALGDKLIKDSVDFEKRTAMIESRVADKQSFYKVNLKKIWEPTELYKTKTLIKNK